MPSPDISPAGNPSGAGERFEELAARLSAVQARIRAAALASERPLPALIVVTKFHPAEDVRTLAALGIGNVGENRDQEAAAKAAAVADLGMRWHFIGQLQTNKARSVASYADSVHSVDRASLAVALSKAAVAEQERRGRGPLKCFLQVNLDPGASQVGGTPGTRGGAVPSALAELGDTVSALPGLDLAGVMAVAPLGADPEEAFQRLARISAALVRDHPGATGISAGMSQDLEQAIHAGATHLRVGSDVLGPRPALG